MNVSPPGSVLDGRDADRRIGRVTVVITTRRRPSLLREQLDAVVRQRSSIAFEVVVIDDGPDPATQQIVASYDKTDPPVKYVATAGGIGVATARNTGAANGTGDVLVFCDDDDRVCPGWLQGLIDGLYGADLVTGPLDYATLNSPQAIAWRGLGSSEPGVPEGTAGPYAPGCNMALRRVAFDAVGGFDETIGCAGEDQDFSWRVQHAGFSYAFAPEAMVRYRLRDNLWAAATQAFANGRGSLAVDLRWGGAPVTVHLFFARWWWLAAHVHWIAGGPERRGRWTVLAARTCGRVLAGARHGVLYA